MKKHFKKYVYINIGLIYEKNYSYIPVSPCFRLEPDAEREDC